MTKASDNLFAKLIIQEAADDGSDFSNPSADYRVFFVGEDGDLHLKSSGGTVTDFPAGGGGGGSGIGWDTIIRKTANETVNASTTLQNDDHLLYALAASEVAEAECVIWYASGTTPDLKVAFTVPSGDIFVQWTGTNASDAVLGGGVTAGSGTTRDLQGGGPSATDPNRCAIARILVRNGATPGNLQLQWAQNTSNASDSIVFANSLLKVRTLA